MATIDKLLKAARDAEYRAGIYSEAARQMYQELMNNAGRLTSQQVEWFVTSIENHRTSAKAANDHMIQILKELAGESAMSIEAKLAEEPSAM